MAENLSVRAEAISRLKKERFLLSLSENRFRDEVIRPLFRRMGLKDGRELCGPSEEGKDALFLATDKLGIEDVYVVQTKKGSLNLAKKASQNVVEAATQLKTALETPVCFGNGRKKRVPSKAILCASGKINVRAKDFIFDRVKDPRVVFMDVDDLIELLDQHIPEIWFGIDAEISPYLRLLKQNLEDSTEDSVISIAPSEHAQLGAATDKMFVQLTLYRTIFRPQRRKGKVEQVPKFEEIPINGILKKRERLILILGDAGSGKSTCIRRLAYVVASKSLQSEENIAIPIILRGPDVLEAGDTPLVNICAQETMKIARSSKPSFSTPDLSNGRVLILLDALDELVDDNARKKVLTSALCFHQSYPGCQIVITSRGYSFVNELEELKPFTSFRLSPISYKQAQQILARLQRSGSLPIENSKEILRRLEQAHGMELNPLLVTVFAATSEYSRQDIPANITELFKKFTELMLGRWDMSKGLAQQYQAPLKDFVLKLVAYEMHRKRVTSLNICEFKLIVERELSLRGHRADVGRLLDEVLFRSGLFRIIGESVEFRHLLLQEFFAGRGIPSDDLLEGMISDEWWQRAIVFYFGENPGNSRALDAIQKSLTTRPIDEIFTAAVTLGLALQACYLIEVKEKVGIIGAVIEGLAIAKDETVASLGNGERFPLTGFLGYYFFGRDAVASNVLEQRIAEVQRSLIAKELKPADQEIRSFWIIIGLMECGALEQVESLMKSFRPHDPRLLLAVHLGCFIIQHLRVTTREQKRVAERISNTLAERISGLRSQLLDELKTELLEIRGGRVSAIQVRDDGSESQEKS